MVRQRAAGFGRLRDDALIEVIAPRATSGICVTRDFAPLTPVKQALAALTPVNHRVRARARMRGSRHAFPAIAAACLERKSAAQDVAEHRPVAGEAVERVLERRRPIALEREVPDPGEPVACDR